MPNSLPIHTIPLESAKTVKLDCFVLARMILLCVRARETVLSQLKQNAFNILTGQIIASLSLLSIIKCVKSQKNSHEVQWINIEINSHTYTHVYILYICRNFLFDNFTMVNWKRENVHLEECIDDYHREKGKKTGSKKIMLTVHSRHTENRIQLSLSSWREKQKQRVWDRESEIENKV